MKLVRFKAGTEERIGAIVDGQIIDLAASLTAALAGAGSSSETAAIEASARIPFSMRAFLATGEAGRQAAKEALNYAAGHPEAAIGLHPVSQSLESVSLLAPVGDPQKIICIGQNYRDHCAEQNQPLPERAILFAKFPSALNNPGGEIVLPALSEQVDYEAELAFVIGKRAKHVAEADAKEYIAGYMCLNDVTARDIQYSDKQWVRGKTFDTFAPTGPYLLTAEEVADPHDLDISLTLNGETMQKSNTSNLIYKIPYLIHNLSQTMTLLPGDIISTGTPGGVGMYSNPQVFLKSGDTVSVIISGLGTLTNTVA